MRVAHLFAGAGGGVLASEILGHTSVLAVEINEFRCDVLRARQTEGWFQGMCIECGDVRDFDASRYKGIVDCISAGFPCQDISCAGRGKGIEGTRSGLVWEVFRTIDATRAGIVFLENSPRIRTKGRRDIIAAIVERGYSWRDGILSATDAGAPHKRNRWWLLAANVDGMRKLQSQRSKQELWRRPSYGTEATADPLCDRLQVAVQQGWLRKADAEAIETAARYTSAHNWIPHHPSFCRVVHGVANRMDRIAALGDGQVPIQAALAWSILSQERVEE